MPCVRPGPLHHGLRLEASGLEWHQVVARSRELEAITVVQYASAVCSVRTFDTPLEEYRNQNAVYPLGGAVRGGRAQGTYECCANRCP